MEEKKANNVEESIRGASRAAMASLLNLTLLPVIGFIVLLLMLNKSGSSDIEEYHVRLGIKVNLVAACALILVSSMMVLMGGLDSPWTWVYVIIYFTLVHTVFIVFAIWALVRSWSGQQLRSS